MCKKKKNWGVAEQDRVTGTQERQLCDAYTQESWRYRMKFIYAILILGVQTFTSKLLNIIDYKFAESEESQLLV